LNIHNKNLDGVICSMILEKVYSNITSIETTIYKIDSILLELDYSKYDYVILTDVHPQKQKNLYISEKIILFDHQQTIICYNDPVKMHYVIPNKCSAITVKRFVEKYYGIDFAYMDDFIEIVNDYDLYELLFKESCWLNDLLLFKHSRIEFRERFKDFLIYFTDDERKWLNERSVRVKKAYESLEVYELSINGCVIILNEFINEISTMLLTMNGYNIVIVKNNNNNSCSIRSNYKNIDIGEMLRILKIGDGYQNSAGMLIKNDDEFKKNIELIEQYLTKNGGKYDKRKNISNDCNL